MATKKQCKHVQSARVRSSACMRAGMTTCTRMSVHMCSLMCMCMLFSHMERQVGELVVVVAVICSSNKQAQLGIMATRVNK